MVGWWVYGGRCVEGVVWEGWYLAAHVHNYMKVQGPSPIMCSDFIIAQAFKKLIHVPE